MSKRGHAKTKKKKGALSRLRRVVSAAKSQLKRYPRAIIQSVKDRARAEACAAGAFPDLTGHDLAAVWLGHASVLVRVGGMNVLADPVLAHRIGPTLGKVTFGIPRHGPAPFREKDLPCIDLILITHAHFDHLDKPTLKRLVNKKTQVISARGTARLIPGGFGEVIELDWGCSLRIGDVTLGAVRPVHWGARTALDRKRGYNSYTLHPKSGKGVLIAGDTAYTDAFDKLDSLALAVLGIGAYGNWEHAHATPEEAWQMFRACGAAHMLPVHHSTFPMGDEHVDEPMARLLAAAGEERHRIIEAPPGKVWAA